MAEEIFIWDSRYSVGIEEIDNQHKDFFRLINRLQMTAANEASRPFALRLAHELYHYAAYHFLSEENLMIAFHYPDLPDQQQAHQKLLKTLNTRISDLEKDRADLLAFNAFISDWLKNHTLSMDKKIGEYILQLSRRVS